MTYDLDRRKTAEQDLALPAAGQAFDYDAAGRLTSWQQGATPAPIARQTWDLSLVGDWTRTTRDGVVEPRVHTAVHEVTKVGTTGLTYDVRGNLTRDELGQTLQWDPENRLAAARRLIDSDPNQASYTYGRGCASDRPYAGCPRAWPPPSPAPDSDPHTPCTPPAPRCPAAARW